MGDQRRVHGDSSLIFSPNTSLKMKFILAILSCSLAVSYAMPQSKSLPCDICVDMITDIDKFLQEPATIDEILSYAYEICHLLGGILPDLETACMDIFESQLPAIIEDLVENQLNPTEVCTNTLGMCP